MDDINISNMTVLNYARNPELQYAMIELYFIKKSIIHNLSMKDNSFDVNTSFNFTSNIPGLFHLD